MIGEAIILAGGLGTRLRDEVPGIPKCMAPVAGKPFISYVIGHFREQGVRKFILALGYLHGLIEEYIGKEYAKTNLEFRYSVEEKPLGTGGAVKLACSNVSGKEVFVLNGDTFFGIDAAALSAFHANRQSGCTLTLKPMRNFDRYGVVHIDSRQFVTRFEEKKWYDSGLINGGVYALQVESLLGRDFPEVFSFEKDYLEKYHGPEKMSGLVQDRYFIDIGIPDDYRRAQAELPQHV